MLSNTLKVVKNVLAPSSFAPFQVEPGSGKGSERRESEARQCACASELGRAGRLRLERGKEQEDGRQSALASHLEVKESLKERGRERRGLSCGKVSASAVREWSVGQVLLKRNVWSQGPRAVGVDEEEDGRGSLRPRDAQTAPDRRRRPKPEKDDYKTLLEEVYRSRQKVTIPNFLDPLQSKNMTKKQWLALLGLYVTYLFLGASVFYFLEKDQESIQRDRDYKLYEKLVAAIKAYGVNESVTLDLESYCGRPLTENADLESITPRLWDFYNSVFFVITVVSTVGYGNIHPTTPLTRTIMMFYAIIGVPMNGILLTSLAQFFSTVFIRAHKKYKRYESRCGLAVDVLKYLVPGILFFIFAPATAFYYFEDWTYEESVYFAFVTLTTIGFGDMVAGQKQFKEFNRDVILLYKSLLLCWIIFGLGYLIMILGFITRAMRSKRMAQIEHKLVEALTNSKIWHGFSKDIGYLRRIVNEVYLDKFKPVFIDEYHHQKNTFHRSKSLPNFAFGIDEENFFDPIDLHRRKRANSEYMSFKRKFSKVCSESDIGRIDRNATFASASKIHPDELIRHVVGVMGGSVTRHSQDLALPEEPRGVDVFSDDEILKSEAWIDRKDTSVASINYPPTYEEAISPIRKRVRALSECPSLHNGHSLTSDDNLEWTWAGTGSTKIFDIVNERHKRSLAREKIRNGRKASGNLVSGVKWSDPHRRRVKGSSETAFGSKKSVSSNEDAATGDSVHTVPDRSADTRNDGHYVTYTAGSGAQGIGLIHGARGLSKPERSLVELYMSGEHLFSKENRREEASLTEFLYVLSSLHSRINGSRSGDSSGNPEAGPSSPGVESLASLFAPTEASSHLAPPSQSSKPRSSEKLQEPSNLRRLGRFLLRSYARTESSECPQARNRKSVPARCSDSSYAHNNHRSISLADNPSITITMEGNEESEERMGELSRFSVEDANEPKRKSNGLMATLGLRTRRGSTPTMGAFRSASERTRIGLSSESVFIGDVRGTSTTRQQSSRWRLGDACSAKPNLSDVKEVIK